MTAGGAFISALSPSSVVGYRPQSCLKLFSADVIVTRSAFASESGAVPLEYPSHPATIADVRAPAAIQVLISPAQFRFLTY